MRNPKDPAYQAYRLLNLAFVIIPLLVGIDKFFNYMTNWTQYLSGPFNILSSAIDTLMVAGVFEIITGIGMIFKPRIFSYILALWLLAILINLILIGQYGDVALNVFGLFLGALALGRLSYLYDN